MLLAAAAVGAALSVNYDPAALEWRDDASVRVTARDGSPLRTTSGSQGGRARWTPLSEVSPLLVEAVLAAEDRRFYRHPGVDPVAVARAAWSDLRAGRIVSGGSTVTQQLAGLLWPEPRTAAGKLREAVRAVRLELSTDKPAILEQYLNRVSYGHGIQGVGYAAEVYFHRSPAMLTAGQAAVLAALPRAPGAYTGPGGAAALTARRNRILDAMLARGVVDSAEAARARARPVRLRPETPAFRAPHFADWVLARRPASTRGAEVLETTLDPVLQGDVESILRAGLARLDPEGSVRAAVVVEDVASGEVLALVGSPDWSDPEGGQVNAALALRQPGSALKPFLYALGFDRGLSPADVIPDLPFHALDAAGGDVSPRNYDGLFHGPVRAREALASSFNVPAVRLQHRLGTPAVLDELRAAGAGAFPATPEHYGLGLVLGVGEVDLVDLTTAYAGLARGGVWRPAVFLRSARAPGGHPLVFPEAASRRWCGPGAAFLVADVLADPAARVPGFGPSSILELPFPVAVKTGTSTDYRDSWCLGFDGARVVGVWAGHLDGSPLRGLAGAQAAGPIFRQVMLRLHRAGSPPWRGEPPADWERRPVCALSGARPGSACGATVDEWFRPGEYAGRPECRFHRPASRGRITVWPEEYAAWAREAGLAPPGAVPASSGAPAPRIASPVDGSVYFLDPTLGRDQGIRFAAPGAGPEARWVLDGRSLEGGGDERLWPPEPGEHRLELVAPGGRDRVRFTVR